MCSVSMILDHYWDDWTRRKPNQPSKLEIESFQKLVERAKEYDIRNNEPECEMDEKKQKLKNLADEMGINISFIDGK